MKLSPTFWKSLIISPLWLAATSSTFAQIIPDTTLPNNTVTIPTGNRIQIEGGTSAGNSLFHSFKEFSLPTGREAFFNNSSDIQTIFSRVTGGKISNIDGLIRANGGVNLFLINPNGIIFGPNAQLNIGGSFIGSTASSIRFANGSEFSAINPQAPPLLTINVPVGLQFGTNPAPIINQSQARTLITLPFPNPSIPIPTNTGLEVRPGQTLALIGGDVRLEGGNLTAFQGEIHLGSIASSGLVSLTPTLTGLGFGYAEIQNFGNIDLSGKAAVNVSGLGGGAIQLQGGNITLRQGSSLVSNTLGTVNGRSINIRARQFKLQEGSLVSALTLGSGMGGDVTLEASESVEMTGNGRFEYLEQALSRNLNASVLQNGLFTFSAGGGQAGNLRISTGNLVLRDGAVATTTTVAGGAGGNLTVNANSIELYTGGLITGTTGIGNAGSLTVTTGRLFGRNAGVISTATIGRGTGGTINVTASESVEMIGFIPTRSPIAPEASSGLLAVTFAGGTAGDVILNTPRLILRDGAVVSAASLVPGGGKGGNVTAIVTESVEASGTTTASTFRSGLFVTTRGQDTGNLYLETPRLTLRNGARVSASSLGVGDGGTITVIASEFVDISGVSADGRSPSGLFSFSGELNLTTGRIDGTGASGDLKLETGNLTIRNGGTISVSSLTAEQAGDLTVRANSIRLDNGSRIEAENQAGDRGNITLVTQSLQLRRGSQISTNAGSADGGNITINTATLAALENSDITANAKAGSGGRVIINTQGIYGTQFREQQTPDSDITATSELGAQFSGIVQINTPDADPAAGLVPLPETIPDQSNQIAQGCAADRGSRFAIVGRGGLPADPTQTLRGRAIWRDVRSVAQTGSRGGEETRDTRETEEFSAQSPIQNPKSSSAAARSAIQNPLIEATGWVTNEKGQVELVANGPGNSWYQAVDCGSR